MANELAKIVDHVPESILNQNLPLQNLLKVIQGMQDIKESELEEYARRFYYPAITDIRVMRRYVDEWRAEYLESSTTLCIDCLYNNFYRIYRRKGRIDGLEQLLRCLMIVDEPVMVTVNTYVKGKPIILFDDWTFNDCLPNGADIAAEILAPAGEEKWVATLLGDTWETTKHTVDITATLNYTPTQDFLDFIKKVIPLYCPMATLNNLIITLNI